MCVGPLKSHSSAPAANQPQIAPPPPPPAAQTALAGLQLEGTTESGVGAGYSGLRLGAADLRIGGKAFGQPAASVVNPLVKPSFVSARPTGGGFLGPLVNQLKLLGQLGPGAPKTTITSAASYFNAPSLRV